MCTANELEPGAKYKVSMSKSQPAAEPVFPSLRANGSAPTGRANARPMTGSAPSDDRLREAIHVAVSAKIGLLRRGVYHRARRRRDPLAPRNDGGARPNR